MNLDQALRDAAEPVPARVAGPPAQALLDRIVAAPAPAPTYARVRWRPGRTVVAVFAAVAAVAAGAPMAPAPTSSRRSRARLTSSR